jgi:hypothetical protein
MANLHLGDIMSCKETCIILKGDFKPLERIVLTANGNLQRIFSAYFNTKIIVKIIKNDDVSTDVDKLIYDRIVHLVARDRVLCIASSKVLITNDKLIKLIKMENIGIGQLFRFLNLLPEFTLHRVDRTCDYFSRDYTLECDGIRCDIHEVFPNDLFMDLGQNLPYLDEDDNPEPLIV